MQSVTSLGQRTKLKFKSSHQRNLKEKEVGRKKAQMQQTTFT